MLCLAAALRLHAEDSAQSDGQSGAVALNADDVMALFPEALALEEPTAAGMQNVLNERLSLRILPILDVFFARRFTCFG